MSCFNDNYFTCSLLTSSLNYDNTHCGQILTELKIRYKVNQVSTDQYNIYARFELYDDTNFRCRWNLQFFIPVVQESRLSLFSRLNRHALDTI